MIPSMDHIIMAYRNLKRKGIRTALTVSSIAIGVASVLIIGVISSAGKEAVNRELDSLGVNGIAVSGKEEGGDSILENSDLDLIKSVPGVENAMPMVTSTGSISKNGQNTEAILWGIDSGAKQVISLEILRGRAISAPDVTAGSNVCLIDAVTAKSLFYRENAVGETVTLCIGGISEDFTVVGIASPDSGILQSVAGEYVPTFLYLPYTTLQRCLGVNSLSQIAIRIPGRTDSEIDQIAEMIEKTIAGLKPAGGTIRADNLVKQRGRLSNTLNIMTLVLSIIGGISLLVAGLGIMTVMLVSVTERTREIGIKKAIGAKRSAIMKEFLLESLLISLTGSILGMLFAILTTVLGSVILKFHFEFTADLAVTTILIALSCGIVFGVYPALSASKLNPVDALRRE